MSKIEKRDKKLRKKSSCWLFYTKNDRGGICRLCHKVIISNGNTTNLLNHLKRKHTIQWAAATEENDEDSVIEANMEFEVAEDQEVESTELRRATEEVNHTQGLAYQSSDGRTVIWLHPDVHLDQLSSVLQPQMTVVEQASSSSQNGNEAIVEGSGDLVLKEDISLGELIQKEEDTTSSDEAEQKADITDQDHSMVLNTSEEVIQQEDTTHAGEVAQIVTVSSSEDPSTEDNSVSSSPSKVMLANIVTSEASKKMHDNLETSQSKIKLGNLKKNSSKMMLSNSTKATSLPKRTVVVTRCTTPYKAKSKESKPEWVPIKMVGQTPGNSVVKKKSKVKSNVSAHNTGSCGEQKSAVNCGKQKNVDSCTGQNSADNCARQNKASSSRRQKEDAFDYFGKYIATLLRNMPSRKSAFRLQKEMLNWVLKEQMSYED